MAQPIRFVMIGGFLGAGKTTLIGRLARAHQADGKHVCIVTNDQAEGLVDTRLLQSQGFDVNEVAGSCFCCNFDGLTQAMDEFGSRQRPDVIIAEPVGSCTDLIATIAIPMSERLGEKFVPSPYAVLLKPSHGLKILTGSGKGGFSPKAEYIFRKQLEESEVVVLNRIDELRVEQVDTLRRCISEQYPGRPLICLSARTGENVDQLYAALQVEAPPRSWTMEVDYDVYADGEAELGWLNATAELRAKDPFDLDRLAVELVDCIRNELGRLNAEPAHLKVLCSSGGSTSVANLVSSDSETMLSASSDSKNCRADMIVNARVCTTPEQIESITRTCLEKAAQSRDAQLSVEDLKSFRPGRPVPTHRATR